MDYVYYPYDLPTSTSWRIIFNFIATALFILLATSAKKCYEYHLRMRMVQHQEIPLVDALGWLRGSTIVSAPWQLRALPGRWWYFLMVLIALVSYVAHLLASTVDSYYGEALCTFPTGLLINPLSKNEDFFVNPTAFTASFVLAQNAQYYSKELNGCKSGIFDKVPDVSGTQFCAQEPDGVRNDNHTDILGQWTCTSQGSRSYDAHSNITYINNTATDQGMLYRGSFHSSWSSMDKNNSHTHLMLWSTNAINNTGGLWSVKYGIETNYDTWGGARPQMNFSLCTLEPSQYDYNNLTQRIATVIDSTHLLSEWYTLLPEYGYYGHFSNALSNSDVNEAIARLLNTAFMISGSQDNMFNKAAEGTTLYYGCIGTGTRVPRYVLAFVGISAALLVICAIVCLCLRLLLKYKKAFPATKMMPLNLYGWAALAAATDKNEGELHDIKQLKDLVLKLNGDGRVVVELPSGAVMLGECQSIR